MPVYQVMFILNDDDPRLLSIEGAAVTGGLGGDLAFFKDVASINGGAFGDMSAIFFSENGGQTLNSVALVTPEPATMTLLVLGAFGLSQRRKRR